MSDKEMCAVNIKPKTDIWTFKLKDSNGFELDGAPEITANSFDENKPQRNYIGT